VIVKSFDRITETEATSDFCDYWNAAKSCALFVSAAGAELNRSTKRVGPGTGDTDELKSLAVRSVSYMSA